MHFILSAQNDPSEVSVLVQIVDHNVVDADVKRIKDQTEELVRERSLVLDAAHGQRDRAADAALDVDEKRFVFVADKNRDGLLLGWQDREYFDGDYIGVHKRVTLTQGKIENKRLRTVFCFEGRILLAPGGVVCNSDSLMASAPTWDTQQAAQTFNVGNWGSGYFGINEQGQLTVRPVLDQGPEIALVDVLAQAKERGLQTPVLLRFQDLLRHRVQSLNEAFAGAIAEANYQGIYRGVFPVKVNQLREVIEEIVDAGQTFHYGLEAGSKPELFAALAMHRDPESLLICNGYKDEQYLRMALMGNKLGKRVIIVIEKLEELSLVLNLAEVMQVQPMVGIRVRLRSQGEGKWATSGGEDAKFGLTTAEVLEATEILEQRNAKAALKLVHFHVGSQVPNILTIKRAVREGARYYAKLAQMGFPLEYMDVGGGLGIDYNGSRSAVDSSTNYSLPEYTRDVVYTIAEVCDEEKVVHPTIVSESGRAVAAHHSLLVVEVFGMIEKTEILKMHTSIEPAHKLAKNLLELKETLTKKNRREHFHDAVQIKEEAQTRFELGLLDLRAKGQVETLFWEIVEEAVGYYRGLKSVPEEIRRLSDSLTDQFLCNFSLFQSMLDYWSIGQLFPICPLHRLDEEPQHEVSLVDLTCDSDGKVCKFISEGEGPKATLPLHTVRPGEPYYIGIFLLGAYQDILGNFHNLFGRAGEAHIFLDADEPCGFYIEETVAGDTIAEVLQEVQYDKPLLERRMKEQVDAAIKADLVKPSEGMRLLDEYTQGLQASTYLKV